MYYFISVLDTLHFLTIDCSVWFVFFRVAFLFIIVHDDGLSKTEGEASAQLLAIKVKEQRNLPWFAPDLKGESANIEISIIWALLQSTDWKDRALTKQDKGQQTSW